MRILKVRFKNLNSLVGDWSIDFTDPAYTSNGIFAITGPTGAGKTTILDAICLALYGQTPRLGGISQSSNEIMSRRASESEAEVMFETAEGRFRCVWQQRRARNKADGLLQAPKRELTDAATELPLETQIRGVAERVEAITGMDFVRFTRSMMLAQGAFAAFLQSDANNRSDILERITGTEIYSEISKRVFEKKKTETQRLEQLQGEFAGIEVLNAEQVAALEQELQQCVSHLERNQSERDAIANQLLWLERIEELRQAILVHEGKEAELLAQIQAFQPEKAKLTRDDSARKFDREYALLNADRQNLAQEAKNESQLKKRLPDLANAERVCQSNLEAARNELADLERRAQELQPILNRVRELDSDIGKKQEHLDELRKGRDAEQQRLQADRSAFAEEQKKHDQAIDQKKNALEYLETHPNHADLVEQFSGIETELCHLIAKLDDYRDGESKQAEHRKGLTSAQQSHTQRVHERTSKEGILAAAAEALQSGTTKLEQLLAGRLLREYQKDLQTLEEKYVLTRVIAELSDRRAELKDHEPCPLCGATEHPYATGNIPKPNELEGKIQELKSFHRRVEEQDKQNGKLQTAELQARQEVQLAVQSENDAKRRMDEIAQHLADQDATLTRLRENCDRMRAALEEKIRPFGSSHDLLQDPSRLIDELSAARNRWMNAAKEKEGIDSQLKTMEIQLRHLQDSIANRETDVTGKDSEIEQKRGMLESLLEERSKLFGDKDPAREEKTLRDTIDRQKTEVHRKQDNLTRASLDLQNETTKLETIHTLIEKLRESLATAESGLAAFLTAEGFADEQDFQLARLSDDERDRLSEQQRDLDQKLNQLHGSLATDRNYLAAEIEKNLTEKGKEELQQGRDALDLQITNHQKRRGELDLQLGQNAENEKKLNEKQNQIAAQQKECDRWVRLDGLIGSSDGKKYRKFAQGLTFEQLIQFANRQLQRMTDRYLLVPDPAPEKPLELSVMDRYHAGEIRTTKNLSGGEGFLISLALALGLSQMASHKSRVDSLFLDEGFGTLDEEALDVALNTLSDLQQEGKLIGVISHVPALKERISTQIQVAPVGSGRSVLEGPGCSRRMPVC